MHREPIRVDMYTQANEPEVRSEGCDPMSVSQKSAHVSAHVSQHSVMVSNRTQTARPDRESIGVSARPISDLSVREQGDQVTDGRFEPTMVDMPGQTDANLLDDYLKKPMNDSAVNTMPIIFGDAKPKMTSVLI